MKIPISICTTVGYIIIKPETDLQQNSRVFFFLVASTETCWRRCWKKNSIRGKCKQFILAIPWKVYKWYGHRSKQRTRKQWLSIWNTRLGWNCQSKWFLVLYMLHPEQKPVMHVEEPCMVNPCSEEFVHTVMSHFQNVLRRQKGRKSKMDNIDIRWGSIYTWIRYTEGCCDMFKMGYHDKDYKLFLEEHENEYFSQIAINAHFVSKFSKLLLLPGFGHMELNKARFLLKLKWEPVISNISHLLGFTTSRAKLVVWEGIDHHWSKQILSVCLDAIRKELLMSFARKCKTRKYQPFNYYINSGWKLSITKLNYFMTALCFHIS